MQIIEIPPPTERDSRRPVIPGYQDPSLTYAVISILALVYFCELYFPIGGIFKFQPTGETMIAFGAMNKRVIGNTDEWYRIITAPFVNGAIMPLVCNIISLLIIGPDFERLLGRLWFCATFIISAICGSLMAYALDQPLTTAVGTAGTIDGLFTALYVFSFELNGDSRIKLQLRILCGALLCLFPIANALHKDMHILNYGAHFGGTLAGAVIGCVLLKIWPSGKHTRQLQDAALMITAVGSLLLAFSVPMVVLHYSQYERLLWLIPSEQMPLLDTDKMAQSANLIAAWPHDPRGHLFRSFPLLRDGNITGSQRELRLALDDVQALRIIFPKGYEDMIARLFLASTLLLQNKHDQARKIIEPVCQTIDADQPENERELLRIMKDAHYCG